MAKVTQHKEWKPVVIELEDQQEFNDVLYALRHASSNREFFGRPRNSRQERLLHLYQMLEKLL